MASGKVKPDQSRETETAHRARRAKTAAIRPQAIRERYGLDRALFARILGVAPPGLARWEKNGKLPDHAQARARRVTDLLRGLSRVMPKAEVASWLVTPNEACRSAGGRTPADLMEKGRYDKLEAMIYFFESGVAY